MKKSIAEESPHGRMARRVGAAGVALATTLVMAGCHEARGGGYLGAPVDSGVIGVYSGDANFGFNFTCDADMIEAQAAQFEGSYWSQDTTRPGKGRFTVLVFDQGEPSFEAGIFDGDGFSIDLKLGPYANYTRAGNIKGGNIQVDK